MKKRLRKKLEKQHEARKKAILEFYAFMEWFTKTAGMELGEKR